MYLAGKGKHTCIMIPFQPSWFHTFLLVIVIPGAIALVRGVYSEPDAPLLIRDVSCSGSETAILDCPYNMFTQTSCGPFSDAGIVCQGMF